MDNIGVSKTLDSIFGGQEIYGGMDPPPVFKVRE